MCKILSELYLAFVNEEDKGNFEDFWTYNNIGLPLAWLADTNMVTEVSQTGLSCIVETYDMLITSLDLDLEYEYEDFEDLMNKYEEKNKK